MKVRQLNFGIQVDFSNENKHKDYCYHYSNCKQFKDQNIFESVNYLPIHKTIRWLLFLDKLG